MKWISVKERLPDEMKSVLILVKETECNNESNEEPYIYYWRFVGYIEDGEWRSICFHGYKEIKQKKRSKNEKIEVTHWMSLPEIIKED